ncbi:MAG: CbrC family protein [Lachnospiraceae bacterium]|nr:CbrC family protein [Lachnospiraceae bacterium]
MDKFREKYIELKKNYDREYDIDPLFDFRAELEASSLDEAKRVLVDVYTLLQQYKKAYDLFTTLDSKEDNNSKKTAAVMRKNAQDYGDYYEKKQLRKVEKDDRLKKIPTFKYHPNPFLTGAFSELEQPQRCDCCGKETLIRYENNLYSSIENIDCLCPSCIADGSAAKKFDGEFQDEDATDEINDPEGEKIHELIHKTPGYCGWQQEYWRAHCNDYCAFIGYVGSQELKELKIMDEVLDDDCWMDDTKEMIRENLLNGGSFQGYLFRCIHCGKYLLWADYD